MKRLVIGFVCLSLCLGVPLRTLAILPGWEARSTKPLNETAASVVKPSDIVVCHHKAYFAIRPQAQLVYGFGLPARGDFDRIKDLPTNDISLLCVYPDDLAKVTSVVGGQWKKLSLTNEPEAKLLAHSRYNVDFYRRETK